MDLPRIQTSLLEFPLFFDALERDAEAKASAAGRAWASPLAL